ncbi:MAG: hypothetical protein QM605_16200 [Sphingobium sp.]
MRERIMPHERALRAFLLRLGYPVSDVEEIIQEAYLRLMKLERVSHIGDPRRYFLSNGAQTGPPIGVEEGPPFRD